MAKNMRVSESKDTHNAFKSYDSSIGKPRHLRKSGAMGCDCESSAAARDAIFPLRVNTSLLLGKLRISSGQLRAFAKQDALSRQAREADMTTQEKDAVFYRGEEYHLLDVSDNKVLSCKACVGSAYGGVICTACYREQHAKGSSWTFLVQGARVH